MHKTSKRLLWIGLGLACHCRDLRWSVWFSLTYQPSYYRDMVLLLENSGRGKPRSLWRKAFSFAMISATSRAGRPSSTDQEVNAWLAEDLVTHFADQLPPEVHEPRVLFELDRITLAFLLKQGGSNR